MRARIDVSEIEAQTKIRAKYLRALENEEWGLLPGPTFVKSFLRTYATALGLDGKALVEEYRLHHEKPSDIMLEPIVSSPSRSRGRPRPSGPSRLYMAAVGTIGVVIVVLVVLLATNGGSPSKRTSTETSSTPRGKPSKRSARSRGSTHAATRTAGDVLSLSLKPKGVVYVCLIGEDGRKLIPGVDLQPGQSTQTFHAKRFLITLGNNEVTMYLDGTPRAIAASSGAIGYSITKARGRQTLPSAQQPTCA